MNIKDIYPNDKERQEYYGRQSRIDSGIIAGYCLIALAGILVVAIIREALKVIYN